MTNAAAVPFRDGTYVTLRLTAGMYHRFHAPHDMTVDQVTYMSGDTWNVNPIALKRVEKLFCRNERAVIRARLDQGGEPILLVAVAAILVASIRLSFLDTEKAIREGGPRSIPVSAHLSKGQEMGWFEHGSTILLFAPPGFVLAPEVVTGASIRAGKPSPPPIVRKLLRQCCRSSEGWWSVGDRTPDLRNAIATLSQLSYGPSPFRSMEERSTCPQAWVKCRRGVRAAP